jgi:hypothetical protein
MDASIFSDNWIKAIVLDYSYVCAWGIGMLGVVLKMIAIKHPNVPTNTIIELFATVLRIKK